MAKTENTTIRKSEVVSTPGVVLTLTLDEAQALRYICRNISGDPKGPRGLFDNIEAALSSASVRSSASVGLTAFPAFPSEAPRLSSTVFDTDPWRATPRLRW